MLPTALEDETEEARVPTKCRKSSAVKRTKKNAAHASPIGNITRTLRSMLPELRDSYRVRYLGIFGSHVRGDQKRCSDLDILVEFDAVPTLFEFVRLERRLAERLGIRVDLVMKSALKPHIGRRILEEVKSI